MEQNINVVQKLNELFAQKEQTYVLEKNLLEQAIEVCQHKNDTLEQEIVQKEMLHKQEADELTQGYLHEMVQREQDYANQVKNYLEQNHQLITQNNNLNHQLAMAVQNLEQMANSLVELNHIKASWSWKLTLPIRILSSIGGRGDHNYSSISNGIISPIIYGQSVSTSEHKQYPEPLIEQPDPQPTEVNMMKDQIPLAHTIDELLSYHDTEFVACAYRSLLGRAPDQEGMSYYTNRIRAGHSKLTIIRQLLASDEAKRHPQTVRGVSKRLKNDTWRRLPLIGRMICLLKNECTVEMRLSAIEASLYRVQRLIQDHDRLVEIDSPANNSRGTNKSGIQLVDNKSEHDECFTDGLQLTPSAKKIYEKLKNAQRGK